MRGPGVAKKDDDSVTLTRELGSVKILTEVKIFSTAAGVVYTRFSLAQGYNNPSM